MRLKAYFTGWVAAAALLGASATAGATTLVRAGLEQLAASNSDIVVADVLETRSRWSADGRFIVTDVRLLAREVLKGPGSAGAELTVTLLGGTLGGLTTLIVSGAELRQGHRYVLFLNEEELLGARGVLTPREHSQAVFEVVQTKSGARAISQADPGALVPDAQGRRDVPGGAQGLPLDQLLQTVRRQLDAETNP